jgi:hypothetical protein
MYTVKQTTTEKSFFNLFSKEVTKEYKFRTYIDAIKFALFEQIKFIYFEKGTVRTRTNVFKLFYSLEKFKQYAKKNPRHYIGTHTAKGVNLDLYYFALITRNLTKLKKH